MLYNLGLLYRDVIITKYTKRSYYKLKTKIKIYTQNTMLNSFVDYNIDVGTAGHKGSAPTFQILGQSVPFHVTWLPSLKTLKTQK